MMAEQMVEHKGYLKRIGNGIKNKSQWQWLEEKDCNGDHLSDYT